MVGACGAQIANHRFHQSFAAKRTAPPVATALAVDVFGGGVDDIRAPILGLLQGGRGKAVIDHQPRALR